MPNHTIYNLDDTLLQIIKHDLSTPDIVPALMGEAAIGKTSFVRDLENVMDNTKVFTLSVNTLVDRGDLIGARPAQENGEYVQKFFPHETISEAITYAKDNPDMTVVLCLDEINRASEDVTTSAMSMSTERRCGTTPLPDNLRLIVTGNLTGDIQRLDSAKITRFSVYRVTPTAKKFLAIMGDSLHWSIKETLDFDPSLILNKPSDPSMQDSSSEPDTSFGAFIDEADDMELYAAPRTIVGLNAWLTEAEKTGFLATAAATELDTTTGDKKSYLESIIESHTGETLFSAKLYTTLDTKINTANTNMVSGQYTNVTQPITCPDKALMADLRNQSTFTGMQKVCEGISDNDVFIKMVSYILTNENQQAADLNILKALLTTSKSMSLTITKELNKAIVSKFSQDEYNNMAFGVLQNFEESNMNSVFVELNQTLDRII